MAAAHAGAGSGGTSDSASVEGYGTGSPAGDQQPKFEQAAVVRWANKPKPKSLRKRGERPTGGQEGHKGHTLEEVANADRIVQHAPPAQCNACHRLLPESRVVETRQVFDLLPLRFEVTDHQILAAQCTCGNICRGELPDGIVSPVQYGPSVLAAVVHLNHHHMMPVKRTATLMGDFFGLPIRQSIQGVIDCDASPELFEALDALLPDRF